MDIPPYLNDYRRPDGSVDLSRFHADALDARSSYLRALVRDGIAAVQRRVSHVSAPVHTTSSEAR
jgi:hypothetical protein